MATIAISLGSTCSGGAHLRVSAAVDGGTPRTFGFTIDEIRDDLPEEVIENAVLVILRLHLKGMTRTQARAAMTAGFTVVV